MPKPLREKDIAVLQAARYAKTGTITRTCLVEACKRAGASVRIEVNATPDRKELCLIFEEARGGEEKPKRLFTLPVGSGELNLATPHFCWRECLSEFAAFLIERNGLNKPIAKVKVSPYPFAQTRYPAQ